MRRFHFVPNTYHHITLRGARKMDFVHDTRDFYSIVGLLYYMNDITKPARVWKRDIKKQPFLTRPDHWPERKIYIDILCFCIHSNHIHILVRERELGGISRFMHAFPNSISQRYNEKYDGSGSVFQGPYKARKIDDDADLHNVTLYIMAKNVMERYPSGGITGARKHFEDAWQWARKDPFSSFPAYAHTTPSVLIEKDVLAEHFPDSKTFKKEVNNYLRQYHDRNVRS